MIQHMFVSMKEWLDGIRERYQSATEQERGLYHDQLRELKKVSDAFIEEWLQFEEKFTDVQDECGPIDFGSQTVSSNSLYSSEGPKTGPSTTNVGAPNAPAASYPITISEKQPCSYNDMEVPEEAEALVYKGQGYYKLFMFAEAAKLFQEAVAVAPECNLARLFLGMSLMHQQNWNEAQRHFQLLIVLSDFPKWIALGYNALGCIHAVQMNMAYAEKLFRKAYDVYPSFTDSLSNLKSCQQSNGQLSLYFGSTELCCL
ncbi:tetratricopeptide repeat protein [Paenibacillus sp. strain BS8-2]